MCFQSGHVQTFNHVVLCPKQIRAVRFVMHLYTD